MGSAILLRERRCMLLLWLWWLLGLLRRRPLLLNRHLRRNWHPSHSLVRRRSRNGTTDPHLDLGSRRPHPSSTHSTAFLLRHPLVCLVELLRVQDLCVDDLLLPRCRCEAPGSSWYY